MLDLDGRKAGNIERIFASATIKDGETIAREKLFAQCRQHWANVVRAMRGGDENCDRESLAPIHRGCGNVRHSALISHS